MICHCADGGASLAQSLVNLQNQCRHGLSSSRAQTKCIGVVIEEPGGAHCVGIGAKRGRECCTGLLRIRVSQRKNSLFVYTDELKMTKYDA